MKVSDGFTVPLCRGHHRQLHQVGNEMMWWQAHKIEPMAIARQLWAQTHAGGTIDKSSDAKGLEMMKTD